MIVSLIKRFECYFKEQKYTCQFLSFGLSRMKLLFLEALVDLEKAIQLGYLVKHNLEYLLMYR